MSNSEGGIADRGDPLAGPAPSGAGRGYNWANFIHAVRSRKSSDLNAPMEDGAPFIAPEKV